MRTMKAMPTAQNLAWVMPGKLCAIADPPLLPSRVRGSVAVPAGVVLALGLGVAAVEEGVVIAKVEMVGLQPDARRIDRVAMGGEPAVALVDVGADVLG